MTREILKIIAMIAMFIDHYGMIGLAGDNWVLFRAIGRLAFPIFAFQIATGYSHTKNTKKYLLTLFIFALISEIPFNLLQGHIIYPLSQNVMFTFTLGIIFIKAINKFCKFSQNNILNTFEIEEDFLDTNPQTKPIYIINQLAIGGVILVIANLIGFITFVDYYGIGIVMVVMFYIILNLKFNNDKIMQNIKYIQIALLGITMFVLFDSIGGLFIEIAGFEVQVQMFATFSIIPIAMYLLTGEKKSLSGNYDKYFKYFGYLFYPLHMMLLYFIT